METGFYNAHLANALCKNGNFQLCGRYLQPLSLRHIMQLDALENPLWTGSADITAADFLMAARICSNVNFVTKFEAVTDEELVNFDYDKALEVWSEYIDLCWASRPRIQNTPGQGSPYKAPLEQFVVTFLMRKCPGSWSEEELWTMCAAQVFWHFESVREQEQGRSHIVTDEDLERQKKEQDPKEIKAREWRAKQAAILAKLNLPKEKFFELMAKLAANTLPKDWRKQFTKKKGAKK